MKTLIKLLFIAVFGMMFTVTATAASAGSCEAKAVSLSLGKTVTGRLVDEYDSDYGENTGYAAYYFKLRVNRGDSATLVMSGESPYIYDIYEADIYEGESESSPPGWEDASSPYAVESRFILRAGDWDEDSPKSATYYVVIAGENIGESFSLQTMSGEEEATLPQGIDENTAVLVTPKETFASVTKTLTEAHGMGYYFKAQLTAGQKYYFGTYDSTTNSTDIMIYGLDDDSLEPTMAPVTEEIGGTKIAGDTHAGYCVLPSKTAAYVIYVLNETSGENQPVTLLHKVVGARQAKDHPLAATLGAIGSSGASASISPAYRNNTESGFFDAVIDDALVSLTLEKGRKYLFTVDSLTFDPGNLVMEIYDAKGNILVSSGVGFLGEGTVGPMFVYEAAVAGVYYVGVCQNTADSRGDESPVAGLTGRLSVSTVTEDAFLDEYDLAAVDPNAEITPVTPAIGEYGDSPETYDVTGQKHSFGLTDWADTFSLPVRKGITYSFSVKPETGTFEYGGQNVEVSGAGFVYSGVVYTLSGSTKTIVKKVADMSVEPLSVQAGANTTWYLEITKDNQGVPAVYSLHSMASAPDGLGYLTVNIHGPTAEAGARWYLKGDSLSLGNVSGTTMLLPAGAVTVKFTAVRGLSTAADMVGTVNKDKTTTLEAYYNDTFDPLDDKPNAKEKEPTLNKAYAPGKLAPTAAKPVTENRSLWAVDPADWFTFTATEGSYYKFAFQAVSGDAVMQVFGPNSYENEITDFKILKDSSSAVQILAAAKGTYYLKVSHADASNPEDSSYALTASTAAPGLIKLSKRAITVKEGARYAELGVSRTGKDGLVRVKYHTQAMTAISGTNYFPVKEGILTWESGNQKEQKIQIALIPDLVAKWEENKQFNIWFETFSEEDETFDPANEYIPGFVTDTKTKLAITNCIVTITEGAKKTPGAIQVNDPTLDAKKPVITVRAGAGNTVTIPLARVAGASGANGKVAVTATTVKGTANKVADADYVEKSETFVWEDGEEGEKTFTVELKSSTENVSPKTFTVKLAALATDPADAKVKLDRPTITAAAITVNVLNENFDATITDHMKDKTTAAELKSQGVTGIKEAKAGTWFIDSEGRMFSPTAADLTFSLTPQGRFIYVTGAKTNVNYVSDKQKNVKITGVGQIDAFWYEMLPAAVCAAPTIDKAVIKAGEAELCFDREDGIAYRVYCLSAGAKVKNAAGKEVALKLGDAATEVAANGEGRYVVDFECNAANKGKYTWRVDSYFEGGTVTNVAKAAWNLTVLAAPTAGTTPVTAVSGANVYGDEFAFTGAGTNIVLRQGVKTSMTIGSAGSTVKSVAGKLPDGLKLEQDKTSKQWYVRGTPSKVGAFQVLLQETSAPDKVNKIPANPGTSTVLDFTVEAMGTGAGTFNGLATTGDTEDGLRSLAQVAISATTAGKLTANVTIGGKKYAFSDTGYSYVSGEGEESLVTAEMALVQKVTIDKVSQTVTNFLYFTVADMDEANEESWGKEGDVSIVFAYLENAANKTFTQGVRYDGKVGRDNSKTVANKSNDAFIARLGEFSGYYTVALANPNAQQGEPKGNGYLTLTLDAKGKVKIAGLLADGTSYSASSVAACLHGFADGTTAMRVPLYACKSPYVFGGWLEFKTREGEEKPVVCFDSSESAIIWKNDNAASTKDGKNGYSLPLYPVGGWYDLVKNLQRWYLDYEFATDLPTWDDDFGELLAEGYKGYAFAANPLGQNVNVVGDTMSVVKQSLVKDATKKLNDWEKCANASNVKLAFKRATGVVSGTFDLWYEGVNAKGAFEQKSMTGLKHNGVLILSRGDEGYIDDGVLTTGFYLGPKMTYKEGTKSRSWTGSYRFDIKATKVERDWTEVE